MQYTYTIRYRDERGREIVETDTHGRRAVERGCRLLEKACGFPPKGSVDGYVRRMRTLGRAAIGTDYPGHLDDLVRVYQHPHPHHDMSVTP